MKTIGERARDVKVLEEYEAWESDRDNYCNQILEWREQLIAIQICISCSA